MMQRNDLSLARRDVERMLRRAAKAGAEYLATPEMILTGYHADFDQDARDVAVDELRVVCRECGIALILGAGNYRTSAGRKLRKPYIQATVISSQGKIVGTHNKTLPAGGDSDWCTDGKLRELRVFKGEGLTFGATICNDLWATPGYTRGADPRLAALLARKGARAIFHGSASGHSAEYTDFHTSRVEERAKLAGLWIIAAACIEDKRQAANAPTGIVGPDGKWRKQAPLRGERLVVGEVDIE